jgi:hypothetical protein
MGVSIEGDRTIVWPTPSGGYAGAATRLVLSVDGSPAPIAAGETVRWPAGRPHRLWTEDSMMVTLMVEHPIEKAP